MAVLMTPPYVRFFDNSSPSLPLAGGMVYSYSAGTTTPKATYTDYTENTSNPNPVVLDSYGAANIWISGSYKFVITDASGNTIRTVDNISSFTAEATAANDFFESLSGDGSTTVFTVSQDLGTDSKSLLIHVDAGDGKGYQIQAPSTYTISNTTLTFASAPASGTNNIYIYAPFTLLNATTSSAQSAATSATTAALSATTAALYALASTGITGTSTTSLTIGTGSQSLTIETGKVFAAGMNVQILDTANSANYMNGSVTSYDSATGALVVDVTSVGGSGTIATWTVGNNSSFTLPNGTTATTQSGGDNSTKLSTTAYTDKTLLSGSHINLKCSVTTAGASATFTADELVLGTALGGAGIKLGSYSQTVNLGTTGAGGMDTGSAPTSGFVSVYAIWGSSGTSILACNVTTSSGVIYGGSHMPSGYTYSALISTWPTDSSSHFVFGYQEAHRVVTYGGGVVSGGSATSYTSVSLSSYVPPNAKRAGGWAQTDGNGHQLYLSAASSDLGLIVLGCVNTSTGGYGVWNLPLATPQTIYYKVSATTAGVVVNCYEF
ncbi:MAG: hypothetical protein KGL39_17895 [Patescibacteria group bacterium]|nr:hypothetical protein [Patescibacteria group bacterium]